MTERPLPLSGVRIIDLTHDWAGPHATRMLADFGAEVIKVEYAGRMDGMRGAKLEGKTYDLHPRWWEINRNKLGVTLDLHRAHDVAIFKDLVRVSDVVVENSRPGVMEGFGLGYDVLRQLRPDVILVAMSAFGRTGPEGSYAGYGGCIEPISGIQALTAYDRGSRPVRVREVDVTNGVVGTCAIITALVHRQATGEGQRIDLSQTEAGTHALIGEHLLEFALNGRVSLETGNRHPRWAPQGCYPCQGDDKWVTLAVRSDAEWQQLCRVLERPDLAGDARLATAAGRRAHHDELDSAITAWTKQRDHRGAMGLLQAAGLAAGAVLNVQELDQDPHLAARGFFLDADDGSGRYPGVPFRLSGGRGDVRRRGPFLGEHNDQVVRNILGRPENDADRIAPDRIGTAFDME